MRLDNRSALSAILILFLSSARLPAATANLVFNGGFDITNPPLAGWKYDYDDTGNKNYAGNHEFVSITNVPGAKGYALDVSGERYRLWDFGQGVIVDSDPIPVQPNGKYRITVSARSTGCNARVMVEGYRWRPGIKPHPKPKLGELRKCYKFPLINFKGGIPEKFSFPDDSWKRASQEFPEGKMTALGKESFDKVQFLVVHIVAIDMYDYSIPKGMLLHLYIDDVVVERLN